MFSTKDDYDGFTEALEFKDQVALLLTDLVPLQKSAVVVEQGRRREVCCHQNLAKGGVVVVEQGRREVRHHRNPVRELLPSSSKGPRESGVERLN
ncbi:hypothetical protein Pint_04290 [Pistacia integerrima]|uniref:Uncharacterized protein n=1 Tax=Pistacia integerrima TaxID=434235 RepID=A0ACC0Z3X9_9ROSI|nr:hypothetical protein Pint_04290 [Pistacia integerrima]